MVENNMTNNVPITYVPNFVPNPDEVLKRLQTELEWERRDSTPRSEYYTNDFKEAYIYGRGTGRRTYTVKPYHPDILSIRKLLEDYTKTVFEVCFLNRYLNQSDALDGTRIQVQKWTMHVLL